MWLTATGDVDAALQVVQQALGEHQRLPMPLEHARTLLLLGQLLRRRRQKQAAATALEHALSIFDHLESPLWVARARAELARINVHRDRDGDLTPTERLAAKLAADGLSNRDVAAAMYVSLKTVEAHLSRVYRKLGIRSRAELARRMDLLELPEDTTES
jgi:DNA-binding NarL/FixJ family response regulator